MPLYEGDGNGGDGDDGGDHLKVPTLENIELKIRIFSSLLFFYFIYLCLL